MIHSRPPCLPIILPLLCLLAAGCAFVPVSVERAAPTTEEITFAQTQLSAQKKFMATFKPVQQPVAINEIHSWRIQLSTPSGKPVEKAVFHIGGGMPEHGHGFPTRPRVTEIGGGEYRLDGMKFSMHGRWEIKLGVQVGEDFDVLTFNTMIALPVAR